MRTATTRPRAVPTLYVAFELGNTEWVLAMTTGMDQPPLRRVMPARSLKTLQTELARAQAHAVLRSTTAAALCRDFIQQAVIYHCKASQPFVPCAALAAAQICTVAGFSKCAIQRQRISTATSPLYFTPTSIFLRRAARRVPPSTARPRRPQLDREVLSPLPLRRHLESRAIASPRHARMSSLNRVTHRSRTPAPEQQQEFRRPTIAAKKPQPTRTQQSNSP